MSTVIAFPTARPAPQGRREELPGPKIVILPVVRIERHADPLEAQAPEDGSGTLLRLDLARGPAGRR